MLQHSYRGRLLFFFFQAEDGIRDLTVTGVQTCALPISRLRARAQGRLDVARSRAPAALLLPPVDVRGAFPLGQGSRSRPPRGVARGRARTAGSPGSTQTGCGGRELACSHLEER